MARGQRSRNVQFYINVCKSDSMADSLKPKPRGYDVGGGGDEKRTPQCPLLHQFMASEREGKLNQTSARDCKSVIPFSVSVKSILP